MRGAYRQQPAELETFVDVLKRRRPAAEAQQGKPAPAEDPALFLLVLFAAGLAAVPLLGGRLTHLLDVRFRAVWLLQAAIVTQLALIKVFAEVGSPVVHNAVHVGTYLAAGTFVWLNRDVVGTKLLALGGAANFAAIVGNGGTMPMHPVAARAAGFAHFGDGFANSAPSVGSSLWFLGDVFAIPAGIPLANVFSVGDVLLLAAGLLMVWGLTGVGTAAHLPRNA